MQCADAINSFLVARIEERECAEGMGLVIPQRTEFATVVAAFLLRKLALQW